MGKSKGILYIGTRQEYVDEAIQSAHSLREYHPDINISLLTVKGLDTDDLFDHIGYLDGINKDFSDSIILPEYLMYDQTLFLDSDTYIGGDISGIFELLDKKDIVVAHDPTRNGTVKHTYPHKIPDTFPQFNTGVIGLNNVTQVRFLLHMWSEIYHKYQNDFVANLNQPAFRIAAWKCKLDIGTLPPEYNFRIGNFGNALGYASGEIKILHGRSTFWDREKMIKKLNETTEMRVIVNHSYPPNIITEKDIGFIGDKMRKLDQFSWYMYKYGVKKGLKLLGRSIT